MKVAKRNLLGPAIFTAGSLMALLVLMLSTSPVKEVSFAILFFGLALVSLISFGYLIVRLRGEQVSPKGRSRIITLSAFLVILLMFKSAGSLSWIDIVVVALIVFGLLFYIGRRAY